MFARPKSLDHALHGPVISAIARDDPERLFAVLPGEAVVNGWLGTRSILSLTAEHSANKCAMQLFLAGANPYAGSPVPLRDSPVFVAVRAGNYDFVEAVARLIGLVVEPNQEMDPLVQAIGSSDVRMVELLTSQGYDCRWDEKYIRAALAPGVALPVLHALLEADCKIPEDCISTAVSMGAFTQAAAMRVWRGGPNRNVSLLKGILSNTSGRNDEYSSAIQNVLRSDSGQAWQAAVCAAEKVGGARSFLTRLGNEPSCEMDVLFVELGLREADEIEQWIDAGLPINYLDRYGTSAVSNAIRHGALGFAQRLIDLGANISTYDTYGYAPLDYAIRARSGSLFDTCLREAGKVDKVGLARAAHLDLALGGRYLSRLLAAGADIEHRDSLGMTILMKAAHSTLNNLELVAAAGGRINDTDRQGRSALHHAAALGDESICAALIELGADVEHLAIDGSAPQDLSTNPAVIDLIDRASRQKRIANALPLQQSVGVSLRPSDVF